MYICALLPVTLKNQQLRKKRKMEFHSQKCRLTEFGIPFIKKKCLTNYLLFLVLNNSIFFCTQDALLIPLVIFFLSSPAFFPPPLVIFIQAFPSQVYLDNDIYFSRQQELKSYVIMYYNNGLKTIVIISHDSMTCLGNSFAGFCMASLNAVAFILGVGWV